MARKITVQHEGKDIEVELEGWIPQADVDAGYVAKSKVDQIVREEKAKAKRSTLAGALNDPQFKAQALSAWDIDLTKLGTGSGEKLSDQQLAAAKQEWEAKALRPLQEQLKARDDATGKLQRRILHKSILASARAHRVREDLLETLPGGNQPAIVTMLEPAFGLHEDDGEFYARKLDGDGFQPSTRQESLYATVDDYFAGIAKDTKYAKFFEPQRQSVGSGTPKSAQDTAPGVIANDPMSIGRNLADIASGKAVVAGTGA